jgi:hypothetical protein
MTVVGSSYKTEDIKNRNFVFDLWNRVSIYVKAKNSNIVCWYKESQTCLFLEKYSDLLGSIFILASDILYLLGEVFKNFPKRLSSLGFCSINFIGLLSLPFYVHFFKKSVADISFANKLENNKIFYVSFFKTILIASNIVLLCSCFVSSITRMMGMMVLTKSIFLITKLWGSVCLNSMMGLDVFHYYNNKKLLQFLKDQKQEQIDEMLSCYSGDVDVKKSDYKKCADIQETMDKDTWRAFKGSLLKAKDDVFEKRRLFKEVVVKNIQTQQFVSTSDLFLRALGYVAFFFSNLFIGTYIQAGIWTSMAFLYTTQLAIQKYKQYHEQQKAVAVTQMA